MDRKVLLFAHRGGRTWAPENTLAAFGKSLELGVDGIELDIQRCASGELMVFHDSDLTRTTNGAGLICDATYDELRRLSAGSWFAPEFAGEKIPSLAEVLSLVDGQALLNIEIKNLPHKYDGIEEELVALMDGYHHIDRVIFSSFDHGSIKEMAKLRPDWNYAVLMVGVPYDMKSYAEGLNARYFHPEHDSIHAEAAREARELGIKVLPWTVNEERDYARMLELDVSGIITDDPVKLKTFLETVDVLMQG